MTDLRNATLSAKRPTIISRIGFYSDFVRYDDFEAGLASNHLSTPKLSPGSPVGRVSTLPKVQHVVQTEQEISWQYVHTNLLLRTNPEYHICIVWDIWRVSLQWIQLALDAAGSTIMSIISKGCAIKEGGCRCNDAPSSLNTTNTKPGINDAQSRNQIMHEQTQCTPWGFTLHHYIPAIRQMLPVTCSPCSSVCQSARNIQCATRNALEPIPQCVYMTSLYSVRGCVPHSKAKAWPIQPVKGNLKHFHKHDTQEMIQRQCWWSDWQGSIDKNIDIAKLMHSCSRTLPFPIWIWPSALPWPQGSP